jgi:MscS family membrane protein
LLAALALLLGALLPARAAAALLPDLDASSPAALLRSFHGEMDRIAALYGAYRAAPSTAREIEIGVALRRVARELLDLSDIPPALRLKGGNRAVVQLADILARVPPPPPGSVPGDAAGELPAHWTLPGTELRLTRRTDGHRAGEYWFSAGTVARLSEFHAAVIGQPPLRPTPIASWVREQERATGPWLTGLGLQRLPHALQVSVLGDPLWKLLVFVAMIALIASAVRAWRRWAVRPVPLSPWRRRLRLMTSPLVFALLVLTGHLFLNLEVVLAGSIGEAEGIIATAALYIAAAWAAWHACWLLAEAIIAAPTFPEDTFDASLMRVLARVASLAAVILILLYGANDIGVPALGLLAGVSIGGIALALAAQSTVENLLGGLSIFADQPFRVGDEVRQGTLAGIVEAIGPRSTRVRALDGTLTTVPNGELAKAQITNMSARGATLFRHTLNLPAPEHTRDLTALLAAMQAILAADAAVLAGGGLPRVRLIGTEGGTLQVEAVARIATTQAAEFLVAQERLLVALLEALEAAGLRLAPPPA